MMTDVKAAECNITDTDVVIEQMIDHANTPALMMAMIHLSGNTDLLNGNIKPKAPLLHGMQGGLDKSERDQIRQQAIALLKKYRDNNNQLPPPPDKHTVHNMMNFMVGETVADEFVDMFMEEMALDGKDHRAVAVTEKVPAHLCVVIIGAGMSGLLAAIRLQEQGIPFTILEKNPEVGGTWFENSYPGCRVDVSNHFYSYSFEPNHDWNEFYSQRNELLEYFKNVTHRHNIRKNIRFNTEVSSACYDEKSDCWKITCNDSTGKKESLQATVLISAVGQLNRAKWPDIKGREYFRGHGFHSAQWDHSIDLTGKRVAVIGTGASAFQLIPKIAEQAKELLVFQRSPCWMMPNPTYHKQVSDNTKWILKHVPYYARWYRFYLFWITSDGLHPSLKIDATWPHPQRSVNAINDATREFLTANILQQLSDRPDLQKKCVPDYPPYGKRMLQDNGAWLSTLKRNNVSLITDPIHEIDSSGINYGDGKSGEITHADIDVIIYATGFHATEFLYPMDITGKNNIKLNEQWGEDPAAYLGITVPHFPNLFLLYGPGTNLAHAGSIIFHSECQVRYVMDCLRTLIEKNIRALECKTEVLEQWEIKHQQAMQNMVWSHPGMNNWYKNSKGRVVTTSPFRLVDYWLWTKQMSVNDYELKK